MYFLRRPDRRNVGRERRGRTCVARVRARNWDETEVYPSLQHNTGSERWTFCANARESYGDKGELDYAPHHAPVDAVVFCSFIQILLQRSSLEALSFLQETLSPVTAPSDAAEQQDLRALFTALVRGSKGEGDVVEVSELQSSAVLVLTETGLTKLYPS